MHAWVIWKYTYLFNLSGASHPVRLFKSKVWFARLCFRLNNLWRKKWQISSVEAGLGYLNLYLTIWLTWVVPTPCKAFSNRRFDWLADWLGSVSAWNFYFEDYEKGFSNRRFDLLGCASTWTTYLPEWDVYLVSKSETKRTLSKENTFKECTQFQCVDARLSYLKIYLFI